MIRAIPGAFSFILNKGIVIYFWTITWGMVTLISPEPRAHLNNARSQSTTPALAYSCRQVCGFFWVPE